MTPYVFFAIIGYLSGSILFARIVPKQLRGVDVVRLSDDGNPGTANAFAFAGPVVGSIVLFLELAKGFVPVYLAAQRLDTANLAFSLVLAAPVLGHAFPAYWGFKGGGKAIAVSFGALLGILPQNGPVLALAALYLLFSLIIVVYPNFYRSIVTFLLLNLIMLFFGPSPGVTIGVILISLTAVIRHLVRYQGETMTVRVNRVGLTAICLAVVGITVFRALSN